MTSLITVYEASNETLKEVHCGVTALLLPTLERLHAARRPARMARWKPEHAIAYRSLVYSLPRGEAAAYLRKWRKKARPGWIVI